MLATTEQRPPDLPVKARLGRMVYTSILYRSIDVPCAYRIIQHGRMYCRTRYVVNGTPEYIILANNDYRSFYMPSTICVAIGN